MSTDEQAFKIKTIRTRVAAEGWKSKTSTAYFNTKATAEAAALEAHLEAINDGTDAEGWTITRVEIAQDNGTGQYITDHHYSDDLHARAYDLNENLKRAPRA